MSAILRRVRRGIVAVIEPTRRTGWRSPTVSLPRGPRVKQGLAHRLAARVLSGVADAFMLLDDWTRAAHWYERSLVWAPWSAHTWTRLAEACLRGGPLGTTYDHRAGLTMGRIGDIDAATSAAESALDIDPDNALAWDLLSRARGMAADWESSRAAALRATELEPEQSDFWLNLGRSINGSGHLAGGLTPDQLNALDSAWAMGAAAPRGAGRHNAHFHLVRKRVQYQRWGGAFDLVSSPNSSRVDWSSERELRAAVQQPDFDAPADWWFVAAWRLQALGRFRLAEAARRRMADASLASSPVRPTSAPAVVDAVQAHSRLGNHREVTRIMDEARRLRLSTPDRDVLNRLRADVELRRAGNETAFEPPQPDRTDLLDAEHRYRSLVAGRTVAVVGPAPSTAAEGAAIDAHDIVIRTKFTDATRLETPTDGARTDVAYYSDSSSAVLSIELASLLESGELQLAVIRPTMLQQIHAVQLPDQNVRIAPSEDLTVFRSTRFAVARILHDVLRYRPSAVSVYNVTLFTGATTYVEGYQDDVTSAYGPRGLAPVLPMFGHDVGSDFTYLQDLQRAGRFMPDQALGDLLRLDLDGYLERLEPSSP